MITTTRTAAAALQSVDDDAKGHPTRGTHVGAGIHVDLDKSDPGKGGNGAGWTLHEHAVVDAKDGAATYPATPTATKAIADAKAKPDKDRTAREALLASVGVVAVEPEREVLR